MQTERPHARSRVSIPAVPAGQIASGTASGARARGRLSDVVLRHPSASLVPRRSRSTDAQEAQGFTRFYRWHIDAALYELHPPKVTTLLALTVPEPRTQRPFVYDDGTGDHPRRLARNDGVRFGRTRRSKRSEPARASVGPPHRSPLRPASVRVDANDARARSNGLGPRLLEGRELPRRDELPRSTPPR